MANFNIKTTYANDNYMKTYFGVTTSHASSSGFKEFNANGGIKDMGAGTSLIYPLNKYWSFITIANYTRLLNDAAKKGIKIDSLLVGTFIILHVGFRFIGASFEVALNGQDWTQPGATLLSYTWSGLTTESLIFGEHLGWWMALGLILGFMPYFPYSKHAHLFMGPLNYMAKVDC